MRQTQKTRIFKFVFIFIILITFYLFANDVDFVRSISDTKNIHYEQSPGPAQAFEDNSKDQSIFTESNESLNEKSNVPVEPCSNKERLSMIHSMCDPSLNYTNMSADERGHLFYNIFVDTKHKLLACLPPKSGCTTWKNILANNSQDEPLPKDFRMMQLHFGSLPKFGIMMLTDFNETTRRYMLDNYYKIMVARHPLERLRSAYIDKLESGKDLIMQKQIGKPILRMFRPHLPESQLSKGIGVTIGEMIDYMQHTPNFRNPHWVPCYNICQPCRINYDHILKTETLDHDSEYVIRNHLKPTSRGIGIKGNVVAGGHKDASLTPKGRSLDKYIHATPAQLSFLEKYYENDFKMFGYSWKYSLYNGTYSVSSSCVSGAKNHKCC